MRIERILIPTKEAGKIGLKEIDLSRKPLGSVIALVGRNGAGKTRILNYLRNYSKNIDPIGYLENISNIPDSIQKKFNTNQLAKVENFYKTWKNNSNEQIKQQALNNLRSNINQPLQTFKKLSDAYIKYINNDSLIEINKKVINNTSFEDILSNTHFNNSITGNGPIINEFELFNSNSTLEYVSNLTQEITSREYNLFVENRDDLSKIPNEISKDKSYRLFERLKFFIEKFLHKKLTYQQKTSGSQIQSFLYLDNIQFNFSQLSPGQRTLFAYAVLLFYMEVNSSANISESIIIIDEPEKHLHPEAQIELISSLKDIISEKGQLWIATHSIPILSSLESEEIVLVKNNRVIPPSRTTPGNSFNDLMGLDDYVEKLSFFINSISEWAYANFIQQCFTEPEVIFDNNLDDPQFELFVKFISNHNSIDLLDYGAGRGRIGHTLKASEETKSISYFAFDPNYDPNSELSKVPNIQAIIEKTSDIPVNRFDIVLLCNVLHEIPLNQWMEALKTIKKSLKSSGYLVVIEDKHLPRGERAHKHGYLILDNHETNVLLGTKESINPKLLDVKFQDRIEFSAYKKDQINPTKSTIRNALEKLNKRTYSELKKIRNEEPSLSQARLYANATQLHINSKIALDDLKK